jgi:hypothetical protein
MWLSLGFDRLFSAVHNARSVHFKLLGDLALQQFQRESPPQQVIADPSSRNTASAGSQYGMPFWICIQ